MASPRRKISLSILLIIVVSVLVSGLMVAGPPAMADGDRRSEPSHAESIRILNEQLANARLNLVNAIKHTEKYMEGKGVVLLAMYAPVEEGLEIELKVLIGERMTSIRFDAITGKRINSERDDEDDDEGIFGREDNEGNDENGENENDDEGEEEDD